MAGRPRSARRVGFVLLVGLLFCGCARPPAEVAVGSTVRHEAGFTITVPDGWQVQENRRSLALVRQTPYGGGFPTLSVRRVDRAEVEALQIDGSSYSTGETDVVYRYRSWSNTRGRGYRLEAVLDGPGGILVTEASIWDPATSLDRTLFEREFWPIINSIAD